MKIARAIPVHTVKFNAKTYYNIFIGAIPIWVHPALIENNMVVLRGNRFYFDMDHGPDNSINYYLYPGENKITALRSAKYLSILNANEDKWIMSNFNGVFFYFIEHKDDTLRVNSKIEAFEIKDNKIVSVERLAVHGKIDEDIDLDGNW